MAVELGLRERKKQRTRQQIAEVAWNLFVECGFERVTVAEIARAAEVAEATVFNYFPAKEDLVYHAFEDFQEEMLETLRSRTSGRSLVDAFGDFVLEPRGYLASDEPDAAEALEKVARVISESPSLVRRERQIYEQYTAALARLIAAETTAAPDDIEPWVIANALIGLHRGLVEWVRRAVLAGMPIGRVRVGLRRRARRTLRTLKGGVG
jgi:AcrR family transcriptional regulator